MKTKATSKRKIADLKHIFTRFKRAITNIDKALMKIHRFNVYRLKSYNSAKSNSGYEMVFFIVDANSSGEEIVLYCECVPDGIITGYKYFINKYIDKEQAVYLVNGFLLGWLFVKFHVIDEQVFLFSNNFVYKSPSTLM